LNTVQELSWKNRLSLPSMVAKLKVSGQLKWLDPFLPFPSFIDFKLRAGFPFPTISQRIERSSLSFSSFPVLLKRFQAMERIFPASRSGSSKPETSPPSCTTLFEYFL